MKMYFCNELKWKLNFIRKRYGDMSAIEYRCFYKPEGTVWKSFKYAAKNDSDALEKAKEEMKRFNVQKYGVEKLIKERIK